MFIEALFITAKTKNQTTQKSIKRRMDKPAVIYSNNGNKMEGTINSHIIDECQTC